MSHAVMNTFSGMVLDPLNIREEDVRFEDIAHALACCNRFAGHASRPISVAQHSVYVSRLCEGQAHRDGMSEESIKHVSMQGLFHDASEAYLGDVTKWLKMSDAMRAYRDVEDSTQRTIYRLYALSEEQHPIVDWADRLMVRYELRRAFGDGVPGIRVGYEPVDSEERRLIGPWAHVSWQIAEEMFVARYRLLNL